MSKARTLGNFVSTGNPLSDGTIAASELTGTLPVANGGTGVTTSTGTGNVVLSASPTLTGDVTLNAQGDLRFADADSSNWVAFQAPATVASNVTWTLPSADGTSAQVLSTNGSGTLSWATAGGGSGDVVGPASATNNGIALFDGTTGKLLKNSASQDGLIYGLTVGRGAGGVSSNTALGSGALNNASTTGGFNTALGRNTLQTLTSGEENTAVGNSVLNLATTGSNNVGVGNASLAATTTGGSNTALGVGALQRNTSASFNTAIGYQALTYNTTASNNTAVGYQSLYSNVTGTNNTATGFQAGYANTASSGVTAFGYQALTANTSGAENDAFGNVALKANTTGGNNSVFGTVAMFSNTTGSNNVAVGNRALYSNTTSLNNTAVGFQALYSMTATGTGNNNTAVGYQAGYANTGGASVFIGYNAGGSCTAANNIFIGLNAGATNGINVTTGTNNVVVGNAVSLAAATNSNSVVIGDNVNGKGSNTGFISAGGGGVYQGNNSSSWSTTSDQRLKKNIADNNDGLNKINSIRVRNFEYRVEDEITDLPTHCAIRKEGVQLGVIAQELQAVLPECVKQESTGVLSVDTDNLTWYLINAVKELSARVKQLEGN